MTPAARRDALVLALTAAAGAANVLSLTGLGGVPASVMTVNLVLLGLSITHHEGATGWHAVTALAAFAVAVFLAARFIARTGSPEAPASKNTSDGENPSAGQPAATGQGARDGRHAPAAEQPGWPRLVTVVIAAEVVPLAGLLAGWVATGGHPSGAVQLVLCAAAAFAMGLQSAAVRALGVPGLSTTFFTGTLTDVVRGFARGSWRWSQGASGVVALTAGAAAQGAWLSFGALRLAPLLPLALVVLVTAASPRVCRRP